MRFLEATCLKFSLLFPFASVSISAFRVLHTLSSRRLKIAIETSSNRTEIGEVYTGDLNLHLKSYGLGLLRPFISLGTAYKICLALHQPCALQCTGSRSQSCSAWNQMWRHPTSTLRKFAYRAGPQASHCHLMAHKGLGTRLLYTVWDGTNNQLNEKLFFFIYRKTYQKILCHTSFFISFLPVHTNAFHLKVNIFLSVFAWLSALKNERKWRKRFRKSSFSHPSTFYYEFSRVFTGLLGR